MKMWMANDVIVASQSTKSHLTNQRVHNSCIIFEILKSCWFPPKIKKIKNDWSSASAFFTSLCLTLVSTTKGWVEPDLGTWVQFCSRDGHCLQSHRSKVISFTFQNIFVFKNKYKYIQIHCLQSRQSKVTFFTFLNIFIYKNFLKSKSKRWTASWNIVNDIFVAI